MKIESLLIYLVVFSISLVLLGSGLFDSLGPQSLTGESVTILAQKCSDGTVYGHCSSTKPKYCSNGVIIDNCTKCGCSNNMSCIAGGSCNTPPGISNVAIASADNSNLAGRALNCSSLLLDADRDNLNVTVLWSLNNVSNYSFGYNNNYPNGTRFSATLGGGNILAGSWYCQITAYDGKNYSTNRSNTLQISEYICSDGTLSGRCSITKPNYCSNYGLVSNCTSCGCPAGQSCNASTNACYSIIVQPQNCSDGTISGQCSVTLPKYCQNGTFVNNCTACGCPSGQSCNATSNACYTPVIPPQNCSDGTQHGQCSATRPKYCNNGTLVNNCTNCGCPIGLSCNATSNGCYTPTCPDGTLYNQCSVTKPKYCLNGTLADNCTQCGCLSGQLCNSTANTCYIPTCSDGTVYGNCSLTRPRYCSNGTIIDNCSVCGCPSGQACNATSKACYVPMCSDGTLYNLCSATKPKFCSNGMLVDNCTGCGCPSGQDCNATSKACYVPVCSDGTAYGQCSTIKPIYCQNGTLMNNCTSCGCPAGYNCNPSNNSCYVPNIPPTASLPVLMSTFGANTTNEDLNCSSQIADLDGDMMNVTLNWYKDDEMAVTIMYKDMANGTLTSVLKSSNLSVGDWWQCNAVVEDGKSTNNSGFSSKIKILAPPPTNVPPHNPTPLLNSSDGTNTVTGNLNCYDTIMDPNGDRMNATVVWLVNGTPGISVDYNQNMDSGSFFNAVLPSGNLSTGDTWACRIRLYDGMNRSDWGVSNSLTIVAPPAPPQPPTQQPPSGGGTPPSTQPPGGGTPTNGSTPSQPKPACVNKLEVIVPENIYIPQMVTKQVSLIITNKGTCPVSSIAADLMLPLGMKCNLYILDKGLGVNESQTISLTVLPTDVQPGQYPVTVKLDAPNISLSKSATIWLLENPPYTISAGGVSELKVFEYIILLILIDFVCGSVILLVWYRPKKEEDEIPEPIKPRPPIKF